MINTNLLNLIITDTAKLWRATSPWSLCKHQIRSVLNSGGRTQEPPERLTATDPRARPSGRGRTSSFLPGALKAASFKEFQCVSLSLSSTSLSLAANKQLSGYLSRALIKRCQSFTRLPPANQSEASTHAVPAYMQHGGGQRSATNETAFFTVFVSHM